MPLPVNPLLCPDWGSVPFLTLLNPACTSLYMLSALRHGFLLRACVSLFLLMTWPQGSLIFIRFVASEALLPPSEGHSMVPPCPTPQFSCNQSRTFCSLSATFLLELEVPVLCSHQGSLLCEVKCGCFKPLLRRGIISDQGAY